MRVVVIGAGVAGCAAALALDTANCQVLLVDRGVAPSLSSVSADDVFESWDRPGVGQFRQPHNFLGLGRRILRSRFPSVYSTLRQVGAGEIDQSAFLGEHPRASGDDDLATIACRRPVFDAVFREAVDAVLETTTGDVRGLLNQGDTITGVQLADGRHIPADLVIDASGRTARSDGWLQEIGIQPFPAESTECGLLYFSRHYRLRDDEPCPPYASILGGPRGDLGYLAFATFLGDNRTFSLAIMISTTDGELRSLRDPAVFDRVAARLPGLAEWLAAAEPVTAVLPMGQLRNTLRRTVIDERPLARGLVPIGDAYSHTNPTFAFGASVSLWHAVTVADLASTAADTADLSLAFERAVSADAEQRFAAVSAEDADRRRLWSGAPLDVGDRTQTMALFLRFVVYRAAVADPEILRAVARRINALDPANALAENAELLDRAGQLVATMPPLPTLPRGDLLAAVGGAATT